MATSPCAQRLLLCPTDPRQDEKLGCALQLSLSGLALSQGHRVVPEPFLRDLVWPCTLYPMGGEPVLKVFSSPFLRAAPSHPLSGRAAELREMGAVCLLGADF